MFLLNKINYLLNKKVHLTQNFASDQDAYFTLCISNIREAAHNKNNNPMPEFITYIIIHRYSIVGAILLACFIGYVAYLNLSINNFNVASVKFRSAPLSLPSLALSTPLLLFGLKTKMLSLKPLSLICKLPLLSSVIS